MGYPPDRMPSSHRFLVVAFFAAYLVIGFLIVDDYGISFDEAVQRRHGHLAVMAAADLLGIDDLPLVTDNNGLAPYGMIFQIAATLLEIQQDAIDDPYRYYRLRHILNFLLFGVALLFFYRTLRLRWPLRTWLPLLGTAVLLLSPRIFAHAFFNPKDHTLLVFYLIATYTLLNFLSKRSKQALAWHIVASALVLNTRMASLIILAVTVFVLLWEQVFERPGDYRRLWQAAIYLPLSLLLMLPFFPYLWADTGTRFSGAVSSMADYNWRGTVVLFGNYLDTYKLPAYYVPAWVLITTPVVYLVFMFTGLGLALRSTLTRIGSGKLWTDRFSQMDFVQLALGCGPVVVVIVLGSTLYNGWRHLHFIYPCLIFLAMVGFERLRRGFPRAAPTILACGMSIVALDMVRMHPQQQVYFNEFIYGSPLVKRFDMDYWGVSYRQAFEQLARKIPKGEVRGVRCQNWPCMDNLRSLPPEYRSKLILEQDWAYADYVATNLIFVDEPRLMWDRLDFFARPIVEIAPRGELIVGIYVLDPFLKRE